MKRFTIFLLITLMSMLFVSTATAQRGRSGMIRFYKDYVKADLQSSTHGGLTSFQVAGTVTLVGTTNLDATDIDGDVDIAGDITSVYGVHYGTTPVISIDNEALGTDTLKLASTQYQVIDIRNTVNGADSIHAILGGVANTFYTFMAVHTDTTVIFVDGGNLKLGGTRALDADTDVLYVWFDGTNYNEVIFNSND